MMESCERSGVSPPPPLDNLCWIYDSNTVTIEAIPITFGGMSSNAFAAITFRFACATPMTR